MKTLVSAFLPLLMISFGEAWWMWNKKPTPLPNWNELSVTFNKYRKLPMTVGDAKKQGWTKDTDCAASNFFRGNRYVKSGDTGVMLLFDSQGKIAGIQSAMPDTVKIAKNRVPPFHHANGKYYLTAYFIDPETICTSPKRAVKGIGDSLRLQTGLTWKHTMNIPLKQSGLDGSVTKWVKGACFGWKMGQHYWYDISSKMDCDDFYPVFLLYNDGVLTGFGWSSAGDFQNDNFEHPPSAVLGLFFKTGTKPECLSKRPRSTMHIYLQPPQVDINC